MQGTEIPLPENEGLDQQVEESKGIDPVIESQKSKESLQYDKLKFDFPFDLNNLFSLQYSFDTLKKAIEFLAKQQGMMARKITDLENKPEPEPTISLDMFKELEALVNNNMEIQTTNFGDVKETTDGLDGRVTTLEEQLEILKKMSQPTGDDGAGLLDALADMRKELEAKIADLEKRVTGCESTDERQQGEIDDLKLLQDNNLSQFDAILLQLKNLKAEKCAQDDFDEESVAIRELINSMGTGAPVEIRAPTPKGPKVSQEDIDRWNAYADKMAKTDADVDKLEKEVDQHKDWIRDIQSKMLEFVEKDDFQDLKNDVHQNTQDQIVMKEDIKTLFDEIDKLKNALGDKCNIDEFQLLRTRVDTLENQLAALRKAMGDLEKRVKGMKVGGGGADQGLVDQLADELARLRAEFEDNRTKHGQRLNNLEDEMPLKANKSDLVDLENRIMEKLRDMIQQILNQFANKDDVMKRFAQLSKKIREIMELLAKQGTGDNEQDAMFSKRHLGPLACASCEKNLVNMYGQKADYHAWNKLPFRDPSERIARYGQGFSKILSHMRPGDLLGAGGSPNRNGGLGGSHHQSVDDSGMYPGPRYAPHPDAMAQSDQQSAFRNSAGFYRAGKTQQADRRNSSQGPHGGFGNATTNPGTSVDEGLVNTDPRGYDGNSSYLGVSPAKQSPIVGQRAFVSPNKIMGSLGSTDTLPKLKSNKK